MIIYSQSIVYYIFVTIIVKINFLSNFVLTFLRFGYNMYISFFGTEGKCPFYNPKENHMETIDSARIIKTHNGSMSIMLEATDSDRKTTTIYLPEDIRKVICEELAFELAYQSVHGEPCNEAEYEKAKKVEEVIHSTLTAGLNDAAINLTQAQAILISVGLPTEGFEL